MDGHEMRAHALPCTAPPCNCTSPCVQTGRVLPTRSKPPHGRACHVTPCPRAHRCMPPPPACRQRIPCARCTHCPWLISACPLHLPARSASPSHAMPPLPRWDVRNLVRMLSVDSRPGQQQQALTTISDMCRDRNPEFLVAIAASGAIPAVVKLLGSGSSAEVHLYAAGALMDLSANTDIADIIAQAGAIPSLVQLWRIGPARIGPARSASRHRGHHRRGWCHSSTFAAPHLITRRRVHRQRSAASLTTQTSRPPSRLPALSLSWYSCCRLALQLALRSMPRACLGSWLRILGSQLLQLVPYLLL
jgi:hypothetical protein